ncbi:MAG: hypothetical protein GYB68_13505 [Chloroflexi bacterium]|nr:hypothetical protein [Chloroflexota bacterium]
MADDPGRSVDLKWLGEDQYAIFVSYSEEVTLEIFQDLMDRFHEMLNSVDYPVAVIADMTRLRRLPKNLLGHSPKLALHPWWTHENVARIIVAVDRGMMERVIEIFSRVFIKVHAFGTLDEALAYAERSRSSSG